MEGICFQERLLIMAKTKEPNYPAITKKSIAQFKRQRIRRPDLSRGTSVKRLCEAVIREAVDKGYADIGDPDWNSAATVEISLTIAEMRAAARYLGWRPSRDALKRTREKRQWVKYIDALDSQVE